MSLRLNQILGGADIRSPIFYDSNDTTYYVNPNSLSNIRHTIFHIGSNLVGATGVGVLFDGNYTTGQYRHRFRKYDDGAGLPLYIDYAHDTANSFTTIARFGGGGSYNPFSVYGTADASGDFRAPIFYDSNNTAFYIDAASTSRLNIVHSNYYIGEITDSGNGDANAPFRFESDYSGWSMIFAGTPGSTNGWGTFWAGNDNPAYYYFGTSNPNEYVFVGAGSVKASIDLDNGQSYFATSLRSPIFYDSDNTGYYLDPASTSNLNATYSNELYARNWFRNVDSGEGLYNESSTQHFYSDSVNYWNIASSASTQGLRFRTGGYNGTIRGYVYVDSSNSIGFLDQSGNWKLRVVNGDYSLADGSSMRAQIFYDTNNTSYYIDPASTSNFNTLNIVDGNLELYKSQTVDMSNTTTYSTSNYYPVTISVPTEGCIIQIQNNLNSNVPSWATHGGGFTLNLIWRTNGSGWGTTGVRRIISQYYEGFANQTICGGITQMGNSSTEVVWLRGGGQYLFKFSRNLTATAQSTTYTVNSQSVTPTSTAQNTIWNAYSGYSILYNNQTVSTDNMYTPVLYDWNNSAYYVDPSSTSNLVGLTVANTITGSVSGNSGTVGGLSVHSSRNNEANKVVRTDSSGYIQAGWINTTSGDNGTTAIDRVYASSDGYIRYYTPANFRTVLDVPTRAGSGASGSWGISVTGSSASCTGNAATATNAVNLSTNRTNWSTNGTITAVVGQLCWKHFGNNHTIIDASNSTSPAGGAISNTNPDVAWTGTYPTLMGWNGANTYGVRVDSARYSDQFSTARNINGTSFNGTAAITTATWGTARTITIGSTGKSVDGSAAVSWSLAEIGAAATNQTMFIGTTSVAINRSSASQTLTGVSINGNAATVTNGVYTNTSNTLTAANYFQSNLGTTSGSLSGPPLQAYATGTNAAFMSFHRAGSYAVNMGLDSDNVLRIGGWSASANRWELDMSGNNWVASSFRAPIFYDSDDTNFYANPAGESKFNYLRLTNNNALYFTTTGAAELNNEGNSTSVAFRMIKSGSSNADGNNYGVLNLQRTNHTNAATNAGASIFFELKDSGGTIREYAGISGCKTEAGAAGGRLIFHRYARTEVGYWDTDQLYSNSSVRSPIFYDSNDTTYYINPASTSRVVALWVRGSSETAGNIYVGGTAAGDRLNINYDQVWTPNGNLHLQYSGGGNIDMNYGGGFTFSRTSLRAPIFYDYNDTAFYVDPASTSVLNRLKIDGGNYAFDYFQSLSDFTSGTLVTTDIPATAAEGESFVMNVVGKSYSASASPFNFTVQGYLYSSTIINYSGIKLDSTGLTSVKIFENGGVLCFWWPTITYWNAFEVSVRAYNSAKNNYNRVTNITNSTEPTGTKKVTVTLQSFLRADVSATNSVDLRSPIFYDSNNTSYYIDAASTSVVNALTVSIINNLNAAITTWHRSSEGKARLYFANSASTYFGTGNNFVFRNTSDSGVLTIDGSGNLRTTTGGDNFASYSLHVGGTGFASTDFRAPIFYDSGDTTYYVDAASTSRLNLLRTRNTFGERATVTSSSSTTVDTQYNVTELTMSASITTLTLSNIQASAIVHMWTIVTVGNGTAYSITWPAAVKWPGGTAPTITSTNTKRDIYQFLTYDGGTNIYGIVVGQNL